MTYLTLNQLKSEHIGHVYSGRPGCMCGCLGKYSYRSDLILVESERRGYEISNEEISDRSVKIIFNRIMKQPKIEMMIDDEGSWVCHETDTVNRAAYLAPGFCLERQLQMSGSGI